MIFPICCIYLFSDTQTCFLQYNLFALAKTYMLQQKLILSTQIYFISFYINRNISCFNAKNSETQNLNSFMLVQGFFLVSITSHTTVLYKKTILLIILQFSHEMLFFARKTLFQRVVHQKVNNVLMCAFRWCLWKR